MWAVFLYRLGMYAWSTVGEGYEQRNDDQSIEDVFFYNKMEIEFLL